MRKLLFIIAIVLVTASCSVPKKTTWTVTSYKTVYIVIAKSKRGSSTFMTDCKPDSIGSKFYAPGKPVKQ